MFDGLGIGGLIIPFLKGKLSAIKVHLELKVATSIIKTLYHSVQTGISRWAQGSRTGTMCPARLTN